MREPAASRGSGFNRLVARTRHDPSSWAFSVLRSNSCVDIEALRAQERLFGLVPSDSTLHRTFRQIGLVTLAGLWEAMAGVRARWRCATLAG